MMRPRQNVIDLFSSFVNFEQDNFKGWILDPKLYRNVQSVLLKISSSKDLENFLALYWHKIWCENASVIAFQHLTAYVQESCYWAAYQTQSKLGYSHYKLSDCFQLAISQVNTVFKNFDSKLGSNLKSYAAITFRSLLINRLRMEQEADLCSDWGLLRKITQKRLQKYLIESGLNSELVEEYILAWDCYKKIFVPNKSSGIRQLTRPGPEIWQEIANLYNQQRLQRLTGKSGVCSASVLESRLQECCNRVRTCLHPKVTSLNELVRGRENTEVIDNFAGCSEPILNELIEAEEALYRNQYQGKLQVFLSEALTRLKPDLQNVLKLYYVDGLTQGEIATKLDVKQYNVSRSLAKAREFLLKELGKWSQINFNLIINTETMAQINKILEEWLESYYSKTQASKV